MCVSLCACLLGLCASGCVCLCACLFVCICLSIYVCDYIWESVFVYICMSVCVFVLYVCVGLRVYLYLSVCLCASGYPHKCTSACVCWQGEGWVCHGILEKDLYCWTFGWFLVVVVQAGSGKQAGRWTSRKASLVVHGVENSKMAGDSGGFGNRITGGQGGAERSG